MIKRINHVAIAVESISETLRLLHQAFGFEESETYLDPEQTFKSSMLRCGDAAVELIEPIAAQGGIAKFVKERGGGLHHLSLEVDDLEHHIKSLQQMGIRLVNDEPQIVGGHKLVFIHPRSTKGVLIELMQKV